MEANLFKFACSFRQEMDSFKNLMVQDSLKGKEFFQRGTDLVDLATQGHFRKFCSKCHEVAQEGAFPLIYFISKALEVSLLSQHLMIAAFILDNGYPLNDSSLPNPFFALLKAPTTDDHCCQVTELLATKNYDFNCQESDTWFTALHYSAQRGLVATVKSLIEHGADVNAVADNDILPLNIIASFNDSESHRQIKDILLNKGAKESWRRGTTNVTNSVGFASVESTSIAVKSTTSTQPSAGPKKVSFSSLLLASQAREMASLRNRDEETVNAVTMAESDDGSAFLFSTG